MTEVKKPVRRVTGIDYRGRPLVVALHRYYISVREKGRRDAVVVGYADIYEFGLKLRARAAAANGGGHGR